MKRSAECRMGMVVAVWEDLTLHAGFLMPQNRLTHPVPPAPFLILAALLLQLCRDLLRPLGFAVAQRYVTVGLTFRFSPAPTTAGAARPFVSLALGVALEEFSETNVCSDYDQNRFWPCKHPPGHDSGGWFRVSGGLAVPIHRRFRLESGLALNGVVMGTGGFAFSTSDEGYWLGLDVGIAAVLW